MTLTTAVLILAAVALTFYLFDKIFASLLIVALLIGALGCFAFAGLCYVAQLVVDAYECVRFNIRLLFV